MGRYGVFYVRGFNVQLWLMKMKKKTLRLNFFIFASLPLKYTLFGTPIRFLITQNGLKLRKIWDWNKIGV
jgi:hypothetical protein